MRWVPISEVAIASSRSAAGTPVLATVTRRRCMPPSVAASTLTVPRNSRRMRTSWPPAISSTSVPQGAVNGSVQERRESARFSGSSAISRSTASSQVSQVPAG